MCQYSLVLLYNIIHRIMYYSIVYDIFQIFQLDNLFYIAEIHFNYKVNPSHTKIFLKM